MKIQLVGVEIIDYKNSLGRQVTGVKIYGVDLTSESPDLSGHMVFDEFISGELQQDLELGEIYEVEFEQKKIRGQYVSKVAGLRKELLPDE